MTTYLYGLAIFTGSFLLFLVQPMVGKILLPCLGGAPSVWTTCMLFFQAVLLAGYVYSEKSIKKLGCEKQSVIHILLMILGSLLLPLDISFVGLENAQNQPILWLFLRLFSSIGFLFFIIAANAPLLQRWYSQTGAPRSTDPYFLYSASNAGSLLALMAYPFVFEPLFSLTTLKKIWSALYLLQIVFVFLSALRFWKNSARHAMEEAKAGAPIAITWKTLGSWVLWGFIPCSAMLAVTTHIATDIASGPMLWIFPLSIYLVSFILVFASKDRYRSIRWDRYLFPVSVLIGLMYFFFLREVAWFTIPIHLIFLFLICMSFHSRLANDRPVPAHLNSFFVWMSIGGILGGIFNGIVAPLFFNTQLEYIITAILAVIVVSFSNRKSDDKDFHWLKEFLAYSVVLFCLIVYAHFSLATVTKYFRFNGVIAIILGFSTIALFYRFRRIAGIIFFAACLFAIDHKIDTDQTLLVERSFFGIWKITRLRTDGETVDPDLKVTGVKDVFYCLSHGTTIHGVERKVEVRPLVPLSYYAREGPVGNIFSASLINRWAKNVGVVGLGCGTIAWYGRGWQKIDFYEIDPLVVKIASNPNYFSFLHKSRAKVNVIVGDARYKLNMAADGYYDMLIFDAYSSDSVPVHLLTLEAFQLYLKKLKPDGLLVLHLSNRYFKLGIVVSQIFARLGLKNLEKFDDPKKYSNKYDWYDEGQLSRSHWVAASRSEKRLKLLNGFDSWEEMKTSDAYSIWTDDYANLLQIYNWR